MRLMILVMVTAQVNAWSGPPRCRTTCAYAMSGPEKAATVVQVMTAQSNVKEPAGQSEYGVKVYLSSKVEVQPTLLWYGQETATSLFAKIGVRLIWRSGRWRPSPKVDSGCMDELGERELALEIAPQAPEFIDKTALALAIPHADGTNRVVIFFDRVKSVLQRHRHGPQPTIFGYVLAHELGHTLGITRHSESGVMRELWTEDDFTQMANGALVFTTQDAALVRQSFMPRNASAGCMDGESQKLQHGHRILKQ